MDKKNTTIGALLLIAAFAVFLFAPRSTPPTQPGNAQPATTAAAPATTPAAPTPPAPTGTFAAVNTDSAGATVTTLSNDFIEARLTNFGGAVREIAFKKYPDIEGRRDPYVFNHLHEDPILALTDYPELGRGTRFELVSASPAEVVYRAVLGSKLEVTRRYRLTRDDEPGGDPYRLRHETTFRNLTAEAITLPRFAVSLGTAALLNANDTGQYLNVMMFDGHSPTYTDRGELAGGGFLSLLGMGSEAKSVLEKQGAVAWAAVKNQFFASIFTPDTPGIGVVTRQIDLTSQAPFADTRRQNIGVTGAARFDIGGIAPNGTAKLGGVLYVGPKEYKRLAKFDKGEDRVMQFDRYFFNRIFLSRYVAPLENTLLNAAHSWVGNWGAAVIVMTLLLKIVSLPFTIAASRSAKRMAKLQPELQAIRERHKDNPQKQQLATMALFKEHKVNPLGGCIPILITFPLFIGFFAMLQGTAELRFAPFLWAKDLAAPDTVAVLFGIPINILPLLMGATMIYQMRLTPQPSVDNTQAMMMKFMPIVFIVFCYNFSCALSLYSTINGLFTIGQQLVINKMKDDGDPAGPDKAGRAGGSRPMKNVTPASKKLK